MKTAVIAALGAAALLLGLDKVRNEHRMTEMYERQAVALEHLAVTHEAIRQLRAQRDLKSKVESEKVQRAKQQREAILESQARAIGPCGLPGDSCEDKLRAFARSPATLPPCAEGLHLPTRIELTDEELGCRK